MQDSGYGYPPVEDRSQGLPLPLCALAATNQNVPPEPIDALPEGAQLTDIPGNSMVLVVASDHLPKPCTDLTDTIMLPAEKLNLDDLQLRNHSLIRRNPPDGEGIGLVASPAVVSEAQEREGLRFPFAPLFPFVGCKTPELDQPSLFRVKFQAELRQPQKSIKEERAVTRPELENAVIFPPKWFAIASPMMYSWCDRFRGSLRRFSGSEAQAKSIPGWLSGDSARQA